MKVINCNKCGRFFLVLDNSYELQKCTGCGSSDLHETIYTLDGNNIDWEQRRYEIAKSAMNAMLANPEILEVVTNKEYVVRPSCQERVAKVSVVYADALIAELKK